jgi:hypothetical protein
MKHLIMAMLGMSACTAHALTFGGFFLQTITQTNDPAYFVGQTFTGRYFYESETEEGTFYTGNFTPPLTPKPQGAKATLDGTIEIPFSYDRTVSTPFGPLVEDGFGFLNPSLLSTRNEGTLAVQGGQVADFLWSWEVGDFWALVEEDRFVVHSHYSSSFAPLVTTRGTVLFGAPRSIPENSSSLWLLAGAFSVLLGARWRKSKQH